MEQAASVEKSIDDGAISARQLALVALCGLLSMIDGFDGQAMAYAAPAIAKEYAIPVAEFGIVFGAGSFGSLAGVLAQGPLGDKFGRKTLILAAFLVVAVASLATVAATTIGQLTALRFIAGVGLGGALPNLFAITSEYTPKRRRSTFVTAMFCGVPLGAVLGGMAAASVLPSHGWRLVFYFGGLAPLALLPAALFFVPESLSFLATRPHARERIAKILAGMNIAAPSRVDAPGADDQRAIFGIIALELFADGRLQGTLLLSIISFLSLVVSISLTNWLPLILDQAGVTLSMAVIGGVVLSGGGMLGALFFAILTDKYDVYKILGPAYLVAALSVAAIGAVPPFETPVTIVIFLAGFFFIGAQMCFPTLVAIYYPASLRAAGIGWTMGVGRIGAIVGPMFTGFLLAKNVTTSNLFYLAAGVTLAAMIALLSLGHLQRRRAEAA